MSYAFRIDTNPIGKGRHRTTKHGTHYTPAKTVSAEKYVKLLAAQVYSGAPWTGAVRVDFEMVYRMPKRLPTDRDWPSCKPDADNVIKLVLDALNRQMYSDDSNVTQGSWLKRYTVGEELPHVDVKVTFLRRSVRRKRRNG